jgi:hypothetical protein
MVKWVSVRFVKHDVIKLVIFTVAGASTTIIAVQKSNLRKDRRLKQLCRELLAKILNLPTIKIVQIVVKPRVIEVQSSHRILMSNLSKLNE